jgi:exodeoxyribonuclease VII small subunit
MSNQESKDLQTFEQAMAQLEGIVGALESGNIPLSDLVEQYEKGSKLAEWCRGKLGEASLRIQQVEKHKEALTFQDIEVK